MIAQLIILGFDMLWYDYKCVLLAGISSANVSVKMLSKHNMICVKTFQEINLSLNLIEDEGSVPLLKAISLDKVVQGFSLSSNR